MTFLLGWVLQIVNLQMLHSAPQRHQQFETRMRCVSFLRAISVLFGSIFSKDSSSGGGGRGGEGVVGEAESPVRSMMMMMSSRCYD